MSVLSGLESRLYRRSTRLGQIYETFRERDVPFMAGSVAFTAFLSLLPLLVLLYVVVAVFGQGSLADQVVALAGAFLPEQGQELLAGSLRSRTEPSSGSVISVVVLVWGALRLFVSLDTAFEEIYAATPDESFFDKLQDSVVALSALLLALVAAVGAGVAFAYFDWIPFVGLLAPLVLVLGLTVAFLPIYYFFPDVETTVRSALPGTIIAAVGWAILEGLFQVYISLGQTGGSGLLGGVVVLLTWLYFGSLIVLLGAVVNAVLSGEAEVGPFGGRGIDVGESRPT